MDWFKRMDDVFAPCIGVVENALEQLAGLGVLITPFLVMAKLFHLIAWPWALVFAPIWVSVSLLFMVVWVLGMGWFILSVLAWIAKWAAKQLTKEIQLQQGQVALVAVRSRPAHLGREGTIVFPEAPGQLSRR